MTAGTSADPAADHTSLPSWKLTARQLGDLELILSGAFAPLRGFMTAADATAVASSCTLADGTPWPIQVILEVPADAIAADAVRLVLCDPEGTPLAVLDITERSPVQPPHSTVQPPRGTVHAPDGMAQPPRDTMRPPHDTAQPPHDAGQPGTAGLVRLAGPVTGNRTPEHGPFRRLMIAPEQARALIGDGPVLAFATRAPLGSRRIGQLRHLASQLKARVLLLPLVAGPAEIVRQPDALIRAVLAAADSLPPGTLVVPVPLARRDGAGNSAGAGSGSWPDGRRELAATAIVAAAYGATHLVADDQPYNGPQDGSPQDGSPQNGGPQDPDYPGGRNERGGGTGPVPSLPGAPIPVLPAGDWAFDPRAEVWRPLSLIEAGAEVADLPGDELADLLDAGAPLPAWYAPEAVAAELRHARPPRSERGFVLFLTGLSGSGKSTIARDLRDLLTERGGRRVSLLDGDLVRALLSAGLTFSRADRDLNIARIGYVAAEIARHGGIAICAPIAPFAAARERVRQMVCEVGDFLLIYVATPVQVCEARDRKGLYAKARAGLIGQFTGISDPYEEPEDAALVIDTSVLSREQATEAVMSLLASGGWLPGR